MFVKIASGMAAVLGAACVVAVVLIRADRPPSFGRETYPALVAAVHRGTTRLAEFERAGLSGSPQAARLSLLVGGMMTEMAIRDGGYEEKSVVTPRAA